MPRARSFAKTNTTRIYLGTGLFAAMVGGVVAMTYTGWLKWNPATASERWILLCVCAAINLLLVVVFGLTVERITDRHHCPTKMIVKKKMGPLLRTLYENVY